MLQNLDAISDLLVEGISRPTAWDGGLAAGTIVGSIRPANVLLADIALRIRTAADHLQLSKADLFLIFGPHTVFEGETAAPPGQAKGFLIVETQHELGSMVGKGALKIVYPEDFVCSRANFRRCTDGAVEVVHEDGQRWESEAEAEKVVTQTMRELMAGESLSMSLKCQSTGAPFAGSEGLILCGRREFDPASGRYFLRPAVYGDEEHREADKGLIEFVMNSTAEALTRAGRIGYDRIVHAAETNSTVTARLDLQLPTNVAEGHLRALLEGDPEITIGDEDMTARLRELLAAPDYAPTRCVLAKAAATMQMEHAILLPGSRQCLREALAVLPTSGSPTLEQYRAVVKVFFGTGEVQQNEDILFQQRQPVLRALSVSLSAHCVLNCGEPEVLELFLKTLLDNQRVMLRTLLLRKLPPGEALPRDWFQRCRPLTAEEERRLWALLPGSGITRREVCERFGIVASILEEAAGYREPGKKDPFEESRREFLELAWRAITVRGEVLPSADRILFFTLPYTYDCATPKLGVVTRKPVAVCGSQLRPEAMAAGAVMSVEILFGKLSHGKANALEGAKVAVEGLGNAGKVVVRMLAQRGAKIIGVSDSRGAVVCEEGLQAEELGSILAHKDGGRRLDTWYAAREAEESGKAWRFFGDPAMLKRCAGDLLVLTAAPASVDEETAGELRFRVVCELTGAAVSRAGRRVLKERMVHVIPDNLASAGGMLVSLSEMLQNSAAQFWPREMEEEKLRQQIAESYDLLFRLAGDYSVDIPTASDILALRRMHEIAMYRRRVREQSEALAQRIRQIAPEDHVAVMLDDDEDGAASAAVLRELFRQLGLDLKERLTFLNESFRSSAILEFIRHKGSVNQPVRHVFVLDRSYPLSLAGQENLVRVASQCRVTMVNNHDLPAGLVEPPGRPPFLHEKGERKGPAELGVLLISPQTLRATVPSRQFPTALVLRELARCLVADRPTLTRIDWQAAVGSWLDLPEEKPGEWLLFFAQFNPDKLLETARSIRTVTRVGGSLQAVEALAGVTDPDQHETNPAWGRFAAEHTRLEERVQLLVEKIVLENRGRPLVTHFFTPDELASPTLLARNVSEELDLYHWISERLTRAGDFGQKPIIVGQVMRDLEGKAWLGMRIRSPRGVDLGEVGLPDCFESGGLPNTAVAKVGIGDGAAAREVFEEMVDRVWRKTRPAG